MNGGWFSNGVAKQLFASDLLAVESKQLTLPQEEQEKVLLNIGERFGLRGNDIDQVNSRALAEERKKSTEAGLKSLDQMTLTVIDGDFPREVLASTNLTFGEYKMAARRNRPEDYNARTKSPQQSQPGVLHQGSIDWLEMNDEIEPESRTLVVGFFAAIGFAVAYFGLVFWRRSL